MDLDTRGAHRRCENKHHCDVVNRFSRYNPRESIDYIYMYIIYKVFKDNII